MNEHIKHAEEKMQKCLDALDHEFSTIRAGKASPKVLDKLHIDYYGSPTPIAQVAAISATDARTLTISPWDASQLKVIEKAIQASDIGINPQNDGKTIRMSFPPLTEERRKDLTKQCAKYGEEAKITVRNVRRDTMEKLKKAQKASEITEDDLKNLEKELQKSTDKYTAKIDEEVKAKDKEILSI
ncbi:MAG: ribosome recycling factor [Ruminococcus sp.]|jgi:ribosome recycling factor|nr:ribosome recycling factor [Ruminococcus sp.]